MPKSLDPNARIPIVLEAEKHLENPPTFFFKALTVREEEQLGQLYDFEKEEENKLSKKIQECLEPLLVGWENMGGKVFGKDSLVSFVNSFEAYDLAAQLLRSGRLSYEEKKRSESPLSSGEGSSVKDAESVAVNNTRT